MKSDRYIEIVVILFVQVLKHPEIAKIASKHGKSTANVVIRWHLQVFNIIIIVNILILLIIIILAKHVVSQMGGTLCTKSVTPSRIQENFNVWDFK